MTLRLPHSPQYHVVGLWKMTVQKPWNVFGRTQCYVLPYETGLKSTRGNLRTVLKQPDFLEVIFHFIAVLLCFTCMTLVWISSSWERLLRCRQTSWYFVYCSLRESRSFITWGWASSSSSMGDQAVPLPPPSEPLKRLCWSSDSNSCPVRQEDNRGNKHLWEKNQGLSLEKWTQ